ncbi:MAG: IS110 family transposase [Candidatus Edwardsbacteria bacterium]
MSKELFVGIDTDLDSLTNCFLNNSGDILVNPFDLSNTLPDAQKLESKIDSVMQQHNLDKLLIGTEATNFYDYHIIDFLANSPVLNKYSPQLYRFNPNIIKGFKKSYPDSDKTDPNDSFVIADRLRFGHLPASYNSEKQFLPLRRLTRYRFHLAQSIVREKNYFLAHLFLKFSAIAQNNPFSNTFGNTSLSIIEEFLSVDDIVNAHLDQLIDFILEHSKNKLSQSEAQKISQLLKYAARESYRLRPALDKSVNLILATSISNIRTLSSTIKKIDKTISEEVKAFNNTLITVDGIGPVYSSGILAEIGDIRRFPNESKIAKLAGLAWKKFQSGKFIAVETRMLRCANKYLRYYLIEAANSLRVHNEDYRNFYQKKFQEVSKHKHKRAIALTARKFVRLVFALLSKKQIYSPDFSLNRRSNVT